MRASASAATLGDSRSYRSCKPVCRDCARADSASVIAVSGADRSGGSRRYETVTETSPGAHVEGDCLGTEHATDDQPVAETIGQTLDTRPELGVAADQIAGAGLRHR